PAAAALCLNSRTVSTAASSVFRPSLSNQSALSLIWLRKSAIVGSPASAPKPAPRTYTLRLLARGRGFGCRITWSVVIYRDLAKRRLTHTLCPPNVAHHLRRRLVRRGRLTGTVPRRRRQVH